METAEGCFLCHSDSILRLARDENKYRDKFCIRELKQQEKKIFGKLKTVQRYVNHGALNCVSYFKYSRKCE